MAALAALPGPPFGSSGIHPPARWIELLPHTVCSAPILSGIITSVLNKSSTSAGSVRPRRPTGPFLFPLYSSGVRFASGGGDDDGGDDYHLLLGAGNQLARHVALSHRNAETGKGLV